jgi:hypothetical protein
MHKIEPKTEGFRRIIHSFVLFVEFISGTGWMALPEGLKIASAENSKQALNFYYEKLTVNPDLDMVPRRL